MKIFALIFFFVFGFAGCKAAQTQQMSENRPQQKIAANNVSKEGEEIGYPRFTNSDKQYFGCWRSVEASEIVEYELKFCRLTEKNIQTSKMSNPIAYREAESNNHKDYSVFANRV